MPEIMKSFDQFEIYLNYMDTGVFSKTDVDGKPYKPGEYLDYTPKNEPDVLLNEITGAKVKLASVYDIARRISEGYTTHGNLETPFYYVHCDYTPSSGDKRLQQRASSNLDLNAPVSFKPIQERFDDPGELDRYINGNGRFIIVDLWKNADPNGSTVQQSALAMCDPNSVPDDNYVTTEIRCSDGSSYWDFRVSGGEDDTDCADHKWYYYSNMTVDECWMFVNHDSGRQLKSVPHSAFQIPHGPNITRRSIETRAFVFLE